ncbi:uncharacterized protein LOC132280899 [Cornus florida]|uniref:uncharacterized protein LOC132280899 n=1 Tax=Cornus florida TaxID=4283 RepID=UPI002896DDAA|nr:uncharacterized protein LOC132280899 [Cornus florida]
MFFYCYSLLPPTCSNPKIPFAQETFKLILKIETLYLEEQTLISEIGCSSELKNYWLDATPMKRNHQSECGGCGCEEPVFLFHIRHRGIYRRLCTACVLKNHSGSFCPICFEVYDEPPPPRQRLMCLNCPSITHLSCSASSTSTSASTSTSDGVSRAYQCPPCANPNYTFFNLSSSKIKTEGNTNDGESVRTESGRAIDKDSAKQLLAAATISLKSMNNAASVARVEAEKRSREAAVARKRARESLEPVAYLATKEERGKMDSRSTAEQPKVKLEFDSSVSPPKRVEDQIGADRFQKDGIVSEPPKSGVHVGGQIHRVEEGAKESNGVHSAHPDVEHSTSDSKQSL